MLRRSISSSVADLTSGKAMHRIARKARQGLCLGTTADRSRAVRVAPGRLACVRSPIGRTSGMSPPVMSEPITITVRY
jgi:hypothetical protein